MEFTKLEVAILNWIAAKEPQAAVATQIKSARLKARDWTGHGYFVELDIDRSLAKIENRFPIDGPIIESLQMEGGADSMLWGESGWLTQIEIAAFGETFPKEITEFSLVSRKETRDARSKRLRSPSKLFSLKILQWVGWIFLGTSIFSSFTLLPMALILSILGK